MTTAAVRSRKPFKFSDDDANQHERVLDDQEQEELIEHLRSQNISSSKQQLVALGAALSLSCLLQLIYLSSSSKTSPLFAVAPGTSTDEAPVPLPNVFSLLSIAIHLNLALFLSSQLSPRQNFIPSLQPLSYTVMLPLSAIAPTLCIFLGRSWQTVVWWGFTTLVVLVVRSVKASIASGNESVKELEKLRYSAPGA